MKRITISLPDSLAMVLVDEARRRHRPVSEVARESIECHLSNHGKPREIPFAGIGASKEGDIAENFDRYLHAAWDEKFERERREREDSRNRRAR